MDRAGLLRKGHLYGFLHYGVYLTGLKLLAPFGDGSIEFLMVDLHLYGAPSPEPPHPGREGQKRNPVQEGVSDPGGHVRSSRAQGGKTGSRLAGAPPIDIGHETRAGLMGHKNKLYLAPVHGFNKTGVLPSRIPEDITRSNALQRIDNDLRIASH